MGEKDYLGDSVYVDFDGYGLVLTTRNGMRIVLTLGVYGELTAYVERLRAKAEAATDEGSDG